MAAKVLGRRLTTSVGAGSLSSVPYPVDLGRRISIISHMSKKRRKRRPLSEQIRRAIETCGLSRYQIAKQTGVEQSALSRFVSGERGFTTASLDKLADLLDLEIVMHGPRRK